MGGPGTNDSSSNTTGNRYFHKAFRRQYRLTPHQYHKHGRLR